MKKHFTLLVRNLFIGQLQSFLPHGLLNINLFMANWTIAFYSQPTGDAFVTKGMITGYSGWLYAIFQTNVTLGRYLVIALTFS